MVDPWVSVTLGLSWLLKLNLDVGAEATPHLTPNTSPRVVMTSTPLVTSPGTSPVKCGTLLLLRVDRDLCKLNVSALGACHQGGCHHS